MSSGSGSGGDGGSKVEGQIKVLTWNMCFGCMDTNEYKHDRSATAIATECFEQKDTDNCLVRANKILDEAKKQNYDFIALQEEVNISNVGCSPKYCCVTNNMSLKGVPREFTSNLTTLFDKTKYDLHFVKFGNIRDAWHNYREGEIKDGSQTRPMRADMRPFHILFLKKNGVPYIFINLHGDHSGWADPRKTHNIKRARTVLEKAFENVNNLWSPIGGSLTCNKCPIQTTQTMTDNTPKDYVSGTAEDTKSEQLEENNNADVTDWQKSGNVIIAGDFNSRFIWLGFQLFKATSWPITVSRSEAAVKDAIAASPWTKLIHQKPITWISCKSKSRRNFFNSNPTTDLTKNPDMNEQEYFNLWPDAAFQDYALVNTEKLSFSTDNKIFEVDDFNMQRDCPSDHLPVSSIILHKSSVTQGGKRRRRKTRRKRRKNKKSKRQKQRKSRRKSRRRQRRRRR